MSGVIRGGSDERAWLFAPRSEVPLNDDALDYLSLAARDESARRHGDITAQGKDFEVLREAAPRFKGGEHSILYRAGFDPITVRSVHQIMDHPDLVRFVNQLVPEQELACIIDCVIREMEPGDGFPPHIDYSRPKAKRIEMGYLWPHKAGFVLGLGGEYEGGEFYLPHESTEFKLKRGDMLLMSPNTLHGVREVKKGKRYTMTGDFAEDIPRRYFAR